jgi:hypothetical protein
MKLGSQLLNPTRIGVLCLIVRSLSAATAAAQPVEPAPSAEPSAPAEPYPVPSLPPQRRSRWRLRPRSPMIQR